MSYRLDAYGNLINDGEEPPGILNSIRENRTPNHLTQPTIPSAPLLSSRVQVAPVTNEAIPVNSEATPINNELVYREAIVDWMSNELEKIREWKVKGDKRIEKWQNLVNQVIHEWETAITEGSYCFRSLPTPPALPTPPNIATPPIYLINHNDRWDRKKKEIIKSLSKEKGEIFLSWKRKKMDIIRLWEAEKKNLVKVNNR